jgi:hypothetical protein
MNYFDRIQALDLALLVPVVVGAAYLLFRWSLAGPTE